MVYRQIIIGFTFILAMSSFAADSYLEQSRQLRALPPGISHEVYEQIIEEGASARELVLTPDPRRFEKMKFKTKQSQIYNLMETYYELGILTFSAMMLAPESATHWDHGRLKKEAGDVLDDHMTSLPEGDQDGFVTNFVLHPWVGAGYFTAACREGLSDTEAVLFAVFMSTVVWEYHLEAIIENPSTQDLIYTPGIGSLFGPIFCKLAEKIEKNDGKLLNSKALGKIVSTLVNPSEAFTNLTEAFGNKRYFIETRVRVEKRGNFFPQNSPLYHPNANEYVGIRIDFIPHKKH